MIQQTKDQIEQIHVRRKAGSEQAYREFSIERSAKTFLGTSKSYKQRSLRGHVAASLSPQWGGPTAVIAGLARGLARRGIEITIFAPVKQRDHDNIGQPEGTQVQLVRQDALSRIWTAHSSELARALDREVKNFDLIHIHEIWHHPHFAAYRAAQTARKPYIVTIHGALEPWALGYKRFKKKLYAALIQRRILNEAAAIHAITQEEVKHIQAFGVDNRIVVIPNGIDPEEFQQLPPRKDLGEIYPELHDKQVILFLGRIHPKKGLDILARAFGKVAEDRDDVRLVIAGPDSDGYQAKVEAMLKSGGVRSKTIFTGMLTGEEKLTALGGADLFVLPSYSEGFSMAILEAMICELPVIISHQCYFPEVAETNAGIVIDPNADQLASALIRLLENPKLRAEMGANGRRLVLEKFTWDEISDQMIRLYENVLANWGKRG